MFFEPLISKTRSPGAPVQSELTGEMRALRDIAVNRQSAYMPLSGRDSAAYADLRQNRRRDLEVLIRTGLEDRYRVKALDLICDICEESSWSASGTDALYDMSHPNVDLFAAETACLLGWAARSGAFGAQLRAHLLHQARQRIFTPVTAHDDYEFFSNDPAAAACIMAAAILLDEESTRRQTLIRRMARFADHAIDNLGSMPLKNAMDMWTQLCAAAYVIAGSQSGSLPQDQWLDRIIISHIGGGRFLDPMGEGVTGDINGADIFLMAHMGGDPALKALGAEIYERAPKQSSSLNARAAIDIPGLIKGLRLAPAPRLRHGAAENGTVMIARGGGTAAAVCAEGSVYIAIDNKDIILPAKGLFPVVNGRAPAPYMGAGYWDFALRRADMTADITDCYRGANVRSFQRTAMLDRDEGSVRVVDVIESETPGYLKCAFFSPIKPDNVRGGAIIGNAFFGWDEAETEITHRENGYVIYLTYSLRPGSNIITYIFDRK